MKFLRSEERNINRFIFSVFYLYLCMIKVVAGILQKDGKVLVCQRSPKVLHPLKWEFPGGKVKYNEPPEKALMRELAEELDIKAHIGKLLFQNKFKYNNTTTFNLLFYEIADYYGKITNNVFKKISWVPIKHLNNLDLLEGDKKFIEYFIKSPHQHLLDEYKKKKKAIKKRLNEFKKVKPSNYFYELIYCLLTPQTNAVNAEMVLRVLREKDFFHKNFNPEPYLCNKKSYIRFHKMKAKYLLELKFMWEIISQKLHRKSSVAELREWLVKNVKGLGFKEASHFLRNIGFKKVAILDRHILKNLVRLNILKNIPRTLTASTYLKIEKQFIDYSKRIKIPVADLDLLFWSNETGKILK